MPFTKSFPRQSEKSTYPVWEEISLTNEEENEAHKLASLENIRLMKKCFIQAKKIISDESLTINQGDIVKIAIALFEKNASHSVFWKEAACKEKFDNKFKK